MEFDFNSLFAFIIFGVTIGVVYGMVALGISLIYSGLDIVHFAHGEIYMFGAFFGLVLAKDMSIPYPAALIGAMILAGLMGMLIERVFYRRLTRSGGGYTVAGMGMIICGFGMSVALMNVAFLIGVRMQNHFQLILECRFKYQISQFLKVIYSPLWFLLL